MGSYCRKYVCCCCCGEDEVSNNERYAHLGLTSHDPSGIIGLYEKEPLVSLEEALAPFQGKIKNLSKQIADAKAKCNKTTKDNLTRDESAAIYIYSMAADKDSVYGHLKRALDSNDPAMIKPWAKYLKLFYHGVNKCPNAQREVWQGIPYDKFWDNKLRTGSTPLYTSFGSASYSQKLVQGHLDEKNKSRKIYVAYDHGVAKDVSDYTADKSGESVLIPGMKLSTDHGVEQMPDGSVVYHMVKKKSNID